MYILTPETGYPGYASSLQPKVQTSGYTSTLGDTYRMHNKFHPAIGSWGSWLSRWVSPEIEKRICFIHIPKCGGKSIQRAIANTYKPWPFKSGAHVILAREMAMREAEQLAGQRRGFVRTDLLHYHLALRKARCIMGHYIVNKETVTRYGGGVAFCYYSS